MRCNQMVCEPHTDENDRNQREKKKKIEKTTIIEIVTTAKFSNVRPADYTCDNNSYSIRRAILFFFFLKPTTELFAFRLNTCVCACTR